MILTVVTKKQPYIYPEADGFKIELDEGEELVMDAVNEDGKQIIRVGKWAEDV